MANIIKSSSGFLYKEENWDDLSLLWDLSPNLPDRVATDSDSISLLQGGKRLELLIPAPSNREFVVQNEVEYEPTSAMDKGGFVFRSVTDSQIELETCGDDTEYYKYSKLTIDSNAVLNATASTNGRTWFNYGNTKFVDMNKMGFYIGAESTETPFKVKQFMIYKNNNVIINNFDRKNIVKIYDDNDVEITNQFSIKKKNTQIQIDGTDILYPIDSLKIKVLDRDTGDVYHEGVLKNIYGGDVYEYSYDVEFYINEDLLTNDVYDLGVINRYKNFSLKVCNKEKYAINDKTLKVEYYSAYNPGNKIAKIAYENSDDYCDELKVDFNPGENRLFKLKVEHIEGVSNIEEEYKFNIVLE